MKPDEKNTDMKTSTSIFKKLVGEGYTENFQVTVNGLHAPSQNIYYTPSELRIVNFYRFEGESNPDDNSILYIIETKDGVKGTLFDAYGYQADKTISAFVSQIENIHKR
jgi:hypothetical protein